jgi:F-type H+-transporting ATPase subunit b
MGELGFDVPVLVAQLINVAVLAVLLYYFAYKPMIRALDRRSNRIKEDMEQRGKIGELRASAEEEVKKQIEDGREKGRGIAEQAVQSSQEIREKANQEALALLNEQRALIQQEREQAMNELRNDFADLTVMAAEKVIERSLDMEAHRELIDKVLKEADHK